MDYASTGATTQNTRPETHNPFQCQSIMIAIKSQIPQLTANQYRTAPFVQRASPNQIRTNKIKKDHA